LMYCKLGKIDVLYFRQVAWRDSYLEVKLILIT